MISKLGVIHLTQEERQYLETQIHALILLFKIEDCSIIDIADRVGLK